MDRIPGVAGAVAGLVEPFAAHVLDADGTWDNGRDAGLRFDRTAATWHWWEAALEGLPIPDFRDLLAKGYLEAHGVPLG